VARKDPVSPELRQLVLNRDYAAMRAAGLHAKGQTCVAPLVDPSQWGLCWGRSTLDHIKDQARMGLRAPSDETHLVALCEGHTEAGARAGYQWNTAHRPELRVYLALAVVEDTEDE